mmetsp:Transcript_9930/g.60637  ORF Transcript_9930/g.60637 Transcript_9930/m.60637 type:complete len:116 (-) Transcript_9930:1315-1662(-)
MHRTELESKISNSLQNHLQGEACTLQQRQQHQRLEWLRTRRSIGSMENECHRPVPEAKDQFGQELRDLTRIYSIYYFRGTQTTIAASVHKQHLLWVIGGSCMTESSELKIMTTAH